MNTLKNDVSESGLPSIWREDPNQSWPDVWLDDQEYGRALQVFAINCADIVAYDSAKEVIYLAKRSVQPGLGWWWFGGRVKAGEDYLAAAVRHLGREVGAVIEPQRLRFLDSVRCVWKYRKQEPTDAGSDTTSYVFAYEPTEPELEQLSARLTPSEYVPGEVSDLLPGRSS